MADDDDIDRQIARVVDGLVDRFAGIHDRRAVEGAVANARVQLEDDARVTKHIAVRACRRAIDQLTGHSSNG